MEKPYNRDTARGMLLGLAVGDALGATVEFRPRGTFPKHTEMLGGGPFGVQPGQWTDDTSMALCLADSLLYSAGWDAEDCMRRFVRWRDEGENAVDGVCFDIGSQTSGALSRYLATGDPYAGPTDDRQSGNGGIMRLAPVALAYGDADAAAGAASAQSRITHGSPTCLRLAAAMARALVTGDLGETPSSPPDRADGYVVNCWEAALWAVGSTGSFEEAIIAAVNLGDDADTTGAVAGQLAGRLYGYDAIPERWLTPLWHRESLIARADRLWELTPTDITTQRTPE